MIALIYLEINKMQGRLKALQLQRQIMYSLQKLYGLTVEGRCGSYMRLRRQCGGDSFRTKITSYALVESARQPVRSCVGTTQGFMRGFTSLI